MVARNVTKLDLTVDSVCPVSGGQDAECFVVRRVKAATFWAVSREERKGAALVGMQPSASYRRKRSGTCRAQRRLLMIYRKLSSTTTIYVVTHG